MKLINQLYIVHKFCIDFPLGMLYDAGKGNAARKQHQKGRYDTMLTECLNRFDGCAVRPQLFPPIQDRRVWNALPCRDRWLAEGDAVLANAPLPKPLPLSLWLDFSKTGNRMRFEKVYFQRRRNLCALVMAECVSGEGRYLPAVADYLWAICEERGWQLPAHNAIVDGPVHQHQQPLPDPDRPIIDLFGAETGALVSVAAALLKDRLDGYAPGLNHRLAQEIRQRILQPYLTRHYWWMDDSTKAVCNWTPWCTQNVMLAAALFAKGQDLVDCVRQAAKSLDCFLNAYGEDGCCDEGAQYYRRAALTFYNALDVMNRVVPGAFEDAWKMPKVKNMAEYIVKVHVAGPSYLNFSDCSPIAGRRDIQDYLFAKKVGSKPLLALAAQDIQQAVKSGDPDRMHDVDVCEGTNLYYNVQMALTEQEVLSWHPDQVVEPDSVWYASVGLLVSRAGAYVLGTKAGGNDDNHNHNDTGSVTLYKDGAPLLIDIGVESYTKKTFSPQRYEIWTMQSSWHNLPEFDPEGKAYKQLPGADCRATQVRIRDDLCGMEMELARAWGPVGTVPGLESYRRTVRLTEQGLALRDVTDYPGTVALTLMSVEVPVWENGTLRFGKLARAEVQGAQRVTTQSVEITDERLRWSWPDTLYRTRIWFQGELTLRLQ